MPARDHRSFKLGRLGKDGDVTLNDPHSEAAFWYQYKPAGSRVPGPPVPRLEDIPAGATAQSVLKYPQRLAPDILAALAEVGLRPDHDPQMAGTDPVTAFFYWDRPLSNEEAALVRRADQLVRGALGD